MKIRILLQSAAAIMIAGLAQAETILVSTGKSCTTMVISKNAAGEVIGTTVTTSDCSIPQGTYHYALTINPNVKEITVGFAGVERPAIESHVKNSAEALRKR